MKWTTINTSDERRANSADFRVKTKRWAVDTEQEIVHLFGVYDIGETDAGLASLGHKITTSYSVPSRVAFKFERKLIFVNLGVGGVYAVSPKGSGMVVRRTEGPINRHAKPLFNPISTNLDKLADIAAEYHAKEGQLTSSVILK